VQEWSRLDAYKCSLPAALGPSQLPASKLQSKDPPAKDDGETDSVVLCRHHAARQAQPRPRGRPASSLILVRRRVQLAVQHQRVDLLLDAVVVDARRAHNGLHVDALGRQLIRDAERGNVLHDFALGTRELGIGLSWVCVVAADWYPLEAKVLGDEMRLLLLSV
jgi:hypothetical protein